FELGELLHDQGRDREAAEALAPVVEAAKTDKQVRGSLKDLPLNPQARLYFFQACDSAARRDLDLQKSYLDEAIAADPNDADVLIALYDTSAGDPTRRARILKLVQAADGKFHADIDRHSDEPDAYNEDAWLIGNTEGNYEQAIQYSLNSLSLVKQKQ